MKHSSAAAALIAAVLGSASALAAQDPMQLEDLRTPSSPAFVILGVEPTTIERPTTPRAFALGLLSASGGDLGVLPSNYAAEAAPYWMSRRPSLTFDQYLDPRPRDAVLQTLSLSLATTVLMKGSDTTTALGIGLRFSPVVGRPGTRLRAAADSIGLLQIQIQDLLDSVDVYTEAAADAREAGDAAAEAKAVADSARFTAAAEAAGQASARQSAAFRDAQENGRVGLHVQLAGALAGFYPDNDYAKGTVGRTGLWGTVTYRTESPSIDVIGLARWLWDGSDAGNNAADVGVRGVLTLDRVSASLEFVSRSASGSAAGAEATGFADGRRSVGMIEYRASDDLYLTFSFGQDFKDLGDDRTPVVAILGGQLHFGPRPLLTGTPTPR